MTRDQVIELIRQRLGFNRRLSEENILANMDYVQKLYELGHDSMPLPWFTFTATSAVNTVAGQNYVLLPDGFIQFNDDWLVTVTVDGVVYDMCREEQYSVGGLQNNEPARPQYFAIDATKMYLYPTPNDVYEINIPHYSLLAELSATPDSIWFAQFPILIAEETAHNIMLSTRDTEGLKLSKVHELRADYLRRIEAREHELKSYGSA